MKMEWSNTHYFFGKSLSFFSFKWDPDKMANQIKELE